VPGIDFSGTVGKERTPGLLARCHSRAYRLARWGDLLGWLGTKGFRQCGLSGAAAAGFYDTSSHGDRNAGFLPGIAAVMCPKSRRIDAWARLSTELPIQGLEATLVNAVLAPVPRLPRDFLDEQGRGREVVDVNPEERIGRDPVQT
jgi:hypothetical protein